MNEKILKTIDSINSKIASYQKNYELLKVQNESMLEEIQSFKEQLHDRLQREQEFLATIDKLNHELKVAQNQVVELSERSTGRSMEEIDELVKEIDYCIEQLKK
jgi:chromosome segregation ATPase